MTGNVKKMMGSDFKKFLLYVFLLSLIIGILSFYPIILYAGENHIYAIIAGYFVSLITAVCGFFLNASALKKSMKSFMVIIFGGMGVRMLLIIISAIILIAAIQIEAVTFLGSVLFFYILFMVQEIFFINRLKNKH